MLTQLKVGPSKHSKGGFVFVSRYQQDGTTAIRVASFDYADSNEFEYTATVCVDAPSLPENFVLLKGWTENEGVPEALQTAGLVKFTGMTLPVGFCDAVIAEILPPLAQAIKEAGI